MNTPARDDHAPRRFRCRTCKASGTTTYEYFASRAAASATVCPVCWARGWQACREGKGKAVTTEEDFQNALDADPGDWQTRLVFADWLQERGDPRAEGYRALGKPGCRPTGYTDKDVVAKKPGDTAYWCYWTDPGSAAPHLPRQEIDWLPRDWFALILQSATERGFANRKRRTRRELDDCAALGFSRLPAARRAELLAAGVPA